MLVREFGTPSVHFEADLLPYERVDQVPRAKPPRTAAQARLREVRVSSWVLTQALIGKQASMTAGLHPCLQTTPLR